MPQRLKERIDAIIELNLQEANMVAGQPGPRVPGLMGTQVPADGHAAKPGGRSNG